MKGAWFEPSAHTREIILRAHKYSIFRVIKSTYYSKTLGYFTIKHNFVRLSKRSRLLGYWRMFLFMKKREDKEI